MKNFRNLIAVILTLALTIGMCVCTTICANDIGNLTISTITLSVGGYVSASNGEGIKDGTALCDGKYGTWMQWDASHSAGGVNMELALGGLSRVSRIDVYVATTDWTNKSRKNSKYTALPVKATALSSSGNSWSLASETEYTNSGTLATAVYADTQISSTCTADDLDVISVDIDDVLCTELSLTLKAVGAQLNDDGTHTDATGTTTTRMCVAEIVVYGEELTDVLRNNGEAACTAELNKPSGSDNTEEFLLNDDTGLTGGSIKRLLLSRPSLGEKATEIIFRLDGVYNISAFRANEYWQSKFQNQTTFDDVDLYVGITTDASTQWTQIADGIKFNTATAAGHSENIVCGSSAVTGDSFKMVINGTEHDTKQEYTNDAGEAKTLDLTNNTLTDVALYGAKSDVEHGGSTMKKCSVQSMVGDESYYCVAKTADKIVLNPEYSGKAPGVVAAAAYNAIGELVGVALADSGEEITLTLTSGNEVSFIKLFGWSDTVSAAPMSTTYTRYGATVK